MTDYERLLHSLASADVSFVIVGGVAATIHGSARLTSDLDIVYARDADNIDRLVRALAPLHPYLRGVPDNLHFRFAATIQAGLNFTLTTEAGSIDLLGEITGGGRLADLAAHTIEVSLFGRTYRCLDLETLIRTKRAAGRPRDFEVIAELEAIRGET